MFTTLYVGWSEKGQKYWSCPCFRRRSRLADIRHQTWSLHPGGTVIICQIANGAHSRPVIICDPVRFPILFTPLCKGTCFQIFSCAVVCRPETWKITLNSSSRPPLPPSTPETRKEMVFLMNFPCLSTLWMTRLPAFLKGNYFSCMNVR